VVLIEDRVSSVALGNFVVEVAIIPVGSDASPACVGCKGISVTWAVFILTGVMV
jgi:hypothetical protein